MTNKYMRERHLKKYEVYFGDYEEPKKPYDRLIYPEELLDKKCGGCERFKKRDNPNNHDGYHCCMRPYDEDFFPNQKACVKYWNREKEEAYKKACKEAEENRRKELWSIYSVREPVKLPIVNDGYGIIPECPICGEMPYSTEQCHWCGQRFVQDKDVKEYNEPLTTEMTCISCGEKVTANVSKYNGHKSYHCQSCGCSMIE